MCYNDNPVARAAPYFIIGLITLAFALVVHCLPAARKMFGKNARTVKTVLLVLGAVLLFLAYLQYSTQYFC